MSIDGKLELLKDAKKANEKTTAYERLQLLFDEGTFVQIDEFAKSGEDFAEVLAGFGAVDGCPAYAFAQNSNVAGGAMSKAQAAKICKIYGMAVKTGTPVIGIYDSVGARLKEGVDMLAAFGDILLNSNNLSGVVPQISVILGPCLGTSAMIAASADVIIMSQAAQFAIGTDGKDGSAESAEKEGLTHITVQDDKEAIAAVKQLITLLPSNNLSCAPITDFTNAANADEALNTAAQTISEGNMADAVQVIRAVMDADSFVEIQKDFGTAFVAGLAKLGGNSVGVVASNKATIDADACSKAARFIRFCDAFAIPVVTFVDSLGFASLREAAKLSNAYAEATTVKVTVIIGAAYGPLYVAVAGHGANADITMAWPTAVISALAPETAVAILLNDKLKGSTDPIADRAKLVQEYKDTQASALAAAANGFVEDVIDPLETSEKVFAALDMMLGKRVSRLPKKHANIQL